MLAAKSDAGLGDGRWSGRHSRLLQTLEVVATVVAQLNGAIYCHSPKHNSASCSE
jgi:alkylhydroperoxidase family enzyme